MSKKIKTILIVLLLLVTEAGILSGVYSKKTEEKHERDVVEVAVRLEKEKIAELLNKNGIKLNSGVLSKILPGKIEFVFAPEEDGEYELGEIRLNGRKVSGQVFKDMCENYLDFDCFLVYNKT